jgi:hypothetical protein
MEPRLARLARGVDTHMTKLFLGFLSPASPPPRRQVLVGVEYHQNILRTRTPAVRTDLFGKDPVRLWQLCCKLWKLVYLQHGGYLCSCQHRSFLAVTVYLNFPPHSRAFSTKLHCLITYFWTYFHSHRISGLHHPYSCRRGLRQ